MSTISEGHLSNVISLIKSCIVSRKGGVPLADINAEYESLVGEHIPYASCGFNSLRDLLSSINDIDIKNGTLNVWDEKISHIANMVKKQKTSKKRSKNKQHVDGYKHNEDRYKNDCWPVYRNKNYTSKNRYRSRNNKKSEIPHTQTTPNGNSTNYERKGAGNREENSHKSSCPLIVMKHCHENSCQDKQSTFVFNFYFGKE